MLLKFNFLHSHLDFLPEKLGAFSDERGESFHQDIAQMEKMYSGKLSPNMLGDSCWILIWQTPTGEYEAEKGEVGV
jgi:hypothetical protein